jgi:hypothetical protein
VSEPYRLHQEALEHRIRLQKLVYQKAIQDLRRDFGIEREPEEEKTESRAAPDTKGAKKK